MRCSSTTGRTIAKRFAQPAGRRSSGESAIARIACSRRSSGGNSVRPFRWQADDGRQPRPSTGRLEVTGSGAVRPAVPDCCSRLVSEPLRILGRVKPKELLRLARSLLDEEFPEPGIEATVDEQAVDRELSVIASMDDLEWSIEVDHQGWPAYADGAQHGVPSRFE